MWPIRLFKRTRLLAISIVGIELGPAKTNEPNAGRPHAALCEDVT